MGSLKNEKDWCLLEYALKLDPMNLRFFKNEQKTVAFEKLAVEQNIETIIYFFTIIIIL